MSKSTSTIASSIVTSDHSNRARTFFAGLFGTIALSLVLFCIIIVWLNRTLTDTNTYVSTVAPLVTKPDIQNFIAAKASETLLKNAPGPDVAVALLTPAQLTGETPQQLQADVAKIVNDSVLQIVSSPQFHTVWQNTNTSAHAQLVSQLNSNSSELSLDLSPLVQDVVAELKTTQLAPISDKIDLPADAGKINLKGGSIAKVHQYYKLFQAATLIIVGATVLSIVLCVILSVQHWRTIRRILVGTGIISLVLAIALQAPSIIKPAGADAATQKAALAFAAALFHNLQQFLLIFGIACIVLAISSKIYSKMRQKA